MPDAQTTTTAQDTSWIDRTWESFRCRTCQRLLLKITPQALKAGAALEIQCTRRTCKTMNYLMGA